VPPLPPLSASPLVPAAPLGLGWLVRLRWLVAAAQLLTALVALHGLRLSAAGGWQLSIVALTALSNVALLLLARGAEPRPALPGAVFSLDTLLLTALLGVSGGPSNPFSVLYLVQVTLAAVALGAAWAVWITALSAGCYALLFFLPAAPTDHMAGHGAGFSAHLQGMWLAFTVAAGAIAYLVTGVSAALRRREAELQSMREQAARSERLASLTTLAAGAAHELGTPLGTIAVAARELERAAAAIPGAAALGQDLQLIRAEVDRCRAILDQMGARAGEAAPAAPEPIDVAGLLDEVRAQLPPGEAARLVLRCAPGAALSAPRGALRQVLGNLVRNALAASAAPVQLEVEDAGAALRLRVRDEGSGMSAAVLARAGEPFFTTKEPGKGMGLGLFLARSFAERLGGALELESAPGRGTAATLTLPRGPLR
jgi:two-component system, sensor histidine kinase RegB